MNHEEIENLAKYWIVEQAKESVDPRVQAVTLRLVTDLCKAISDLEVSPTEFWAGVEFIRESGVSGELSLLIPGLGIERFLDILAEKRDAEAGLTGGTLRGIEGPLYVSGAPESRGFARLDDASEEDGSEILIVEGTVYDSQGRFIPNAKVEVWHANTLGNYSFFDKSQSAFNLRRTIYTDEQGRYKLQTIMPTGYEAPEGGQTRQLMALLGRHSRRPAHIHFIISAPGVRKLTTQIHIDGDKHLRDDFAFTSRDGLIPPLIKVTEPSFIKANNLVKPFTKIDFNFHLFVDEMPFASEVALQRKRA